MRTDRTAEIWWVLPMTPSVRLCAPRDSGRERPKYPSEVCELHGDLNEAARAADAARARKGSSGANWGIVGS
jgi:hypothetical protein